MIEIFSYRQHHTQSDRILKNTWSTTWGEQGYMRLQRNTGAATCGTSCISAFPIAAVQGYSVLDDSLWGDDDVVSERQSAGQNLIEVLCIVLLRSYGLFICVHVRVLNRLARAACSTITAIYGANNRTSSARRTMRRRRWTRPGRPSRCECTSHDPCLHPPVVCTLTLHTYHTNKPPFPRSFSS